MLSTDRQLARIQLALTTCSLANLFNSAFFSHFITSSFHLLNSPASTFVGILENHIKGAFLQRDISVPLHHLFISAVKPQSPFTFLPV
jgi:hypothetical protein